MKGRITCRGEWELKLHHHPTHISTYSDLEGVGLFSCFDLGLKDCLFAWFCPCFPAIMSRITVDERECTIWEW